MQVMRSLENRGILLKVTTRKITRLITKNYQGISQFY